MTLLEKFKVYLDEQFKLVPMSKEAAELREEMLGNLMSRAMEMKAEGLGDDEVYDSCIDSLGDYTEAIGALRSPIKTLRDPKFQIGVTALITFSLLCVVTYLVVGVLLNAWGTGAVIIFPTMGVGMYVYATAAVLKRNFRFRKHYTTDLILSTYGVIVCTALFFILWLTHAAPASQAWVTFIYIPVCVIASVILTTACFRKRKVPFILWLMLIMMVSVAVFLTAAAVTRLWHPLWIIVVVGALICGFALCAKMIIKVAGTV